MFNNPRYKLVAHGERVGKTSATQFPDVPCKAVIFKAPASNPTNVYIGQASVTVAAGTDTLTAGWELDASEETILLPCGNLDEFYFICDAVTDDVLFFCFA